MLEGPTFGAFNGDYNNGLWVWYRVAWANGLTGWSTQNWLRKAVDSVAPMVQSSSFQFETAPQTLTTTFSENVGASLTSNDLIVTRDGSTTPIAQTFSYDATTRRATLSFPGGVLPDGRYHLRIAVGSIADAAGNTLATEHNYDFHVLAGDANRDQRVDFADLTILAQNYNLVGRTFSTGNFNYSTDGRVEFGDLVILSQQYNVSLTIVPPTPAAAKANATKRREPAIASIV